MLLLGAQSCQSLVGGGGLPKVQMKDRGGVAEIWPLKVVGGVDKTQDHSH